MANKSQYRTIFFYDYLDLLIKYVYEELEEKEFLEIKNLIAENSSAKILLLGCVKIKEEYNFTSSEQHKKHLDNISSKISKRSEKARKSFQKGLQIADKVLTDLETSKNFKHTY